MPESLYRVKVLILLSVSLESQVDHVERQLAYLSYLRSSIALSA